MLTSIGTTNADLIGFVSYRRRPSRSEADMYVRRRRRHRRRRRPHFFHRLGLRCRRSRFFFIELVKLGFFFSTRSGKSFHSLPSI